MEYNFDRYDTTMVNDYSIPYDYRSIMHYGQYVSIILLNILMRWATKKLPWSSEEKI